MIEVLGWTGAWMLALCGAPQAWYSIRWGHSDGIDPTFLWSWAVGCALMLAYVAVQRPLQAPLVFNYFLNICFTCVIIKYKYWPRR